MEIMEVCKQRARGKEDSVFIMKEIRQKHWLSYKLIKQTGMGGPDSRHYRLIFWQDMLQQFTVNETLKEILGVDRRKFINDENMVVLENQNGIEVVYGDDEGSDLELCGQGMDGVIL